MEQNILNNEKVMFQFLKQLVLDNIPDEIALKVSSSYTDTGVYFDTQEIDSILGSTSYDTTMI